MDHLALKLMALGAALAAATGCASTKQSTSNAGPQTYWEQVQSHVQKATGQEKAPPPAVEFKFAWQNRLQQLPDPSRGGQMTTGIVGQVFLYNRAEAAGEADYTPAEVNGDMIISVSDATPRPAGAPALNHEVWHFTKETLRKMVMTDERFGKCLVVFLPWPAHWQNVNTLSIQARYDQPAGNTLYAQPTLLTLDLQNQYGVATTTNGQAPASFQPVPDPKMVMQRMSAPPVNSPVQQAGVFDKPPPFDARNSAFTPPPPSFPQTGLYAPPGPGMAQGATMQKEFQRTVIPRSQ